MYHPGYVNQGQSEQYPIGYTEGVRLSEIDPEAFRRYFDRWIKYWPKSADPGYNCKYAYDQGWPYKQKNGKNQALFPGYDIELTERHLDNTNWIEWKRLQHPTRIIKEGPFWLGLHAPKRTSVTCIDVDAKDHQDPKARKYLAGYYQVYEPSEVQHQVVRPVMYLPVEHLKTIKVIHDNFPDRIWCVSSATLGLHVWEKFDSPHDTIAVHRRDKERLTKLGLRHTEVHPMFGRCLRRPFGEDYVTLTPDGPLTTWWEQLEFFEFFADTPPLETIVRYLLTSVRDQWDTAKRYGEVREKWNASKQYHKSIDLGRAWDDSQRHLDEAETWINQGCPLSWNRPVATKPAPLSSEEKTTQDPKSSDAPSNKTEHPKFPTFELDIFRHGNWYKGLAEIAVKGLPAPKSLPAVLYEFAKVLYWVELYDLPDREEVIFNVLIQFVHQKHNGHSSRVNNGNWSEVERNVHNAIHLAVKLDPSHRMQSLELFARLRQKRDQGQYKHRIDLLPLLRGEGECIPSPSSRSTYMCINFDAPLPDVIQAQIQAKAGRNKVLPFARKLINLLDANKGSVCISQDKMTDLLGYKNKNQAIKYVDILIAAKVLAKGRYYAQGRRSKRYTLTDEIKALLDDQRRPQQVSTVA